MPVPRSEAVQTTELHGFCEQKTTGMAEGIAGRGIDVPPGIGAGRLHCESAPSCRLVPSSQTSSLFKGIFFLSVQSLAVTDLKYRGSYV